MNVYVLLLRFIIVAVSIQCLVGQQATVTVVINEPAGTQAFGGGFVSSDRGEVLTCYHVIEGATRIRVFYGDRFYNAKATAISPERDIARLQMEGVPLPTKFMPLRYVLPRNILQLDLYVIGFALGLFDQHVRAAATQDHFARSQEMKGIRGETLFRTENVLLLPIATTIYKGMSGSPLIAPDGAVLGLVSGSLSSGGGIAWAIAAENSDSKYMRSVDAPGGGFSWPPLTFMQSGWENLRHQSGIGDNLISALNPVSAALDEARQKTATVCSELGPIIAGLNEMIDVFNKSGFDGIQVAALNKVPGGAAFNQQINSMLDRVNPQTQKAKSDLKAADAALTTAEAKQSEADKQIAEFIRWLPSTPDNVELLSRVLHGSDDVRRRINRLSAEHDRTIASMKDRPKNLVTVGDVHQNAIINRDTYQAFSQIFCGIFPQMNGVLQESILNSRQLLSADLISRNR